MAIVFENVQRRAAEAGKRGEPDQSETLRKLDARQRKVLALFRKSETITATDVAKLFGLAPRSARVPCQKWVQNGFLIVADPAKKSRKYLLSKALEPLVKL